MKTLLLLALSLISFQAPALAKSPAPLRCSFGELGQDNNIRVSMGRSGIEFTMHETSVTAKTNEYVRRGNSIAVLNKTLQVFAEGEEFQSQIDALLVYDRKAMTMNVTLLMNGQTAIDSKTLNCK